jgi:hypothetical protein
MKGKKVKSKWHEMEQANKFFISAWPIVFAAVVAQGTLCYSDLSVKEKLILIDAKFSNPSPLSKWSVA